VNGTSFDWIRRALLGRRRRRLLAAAVALPAAYPFLDYMLIMRGRFISSGLSIKPAASFA
jgi:hypothetical protein